MYGVSRIIIHYVNLHATQAGGVGLRRAGLGAGARAIPEQ
jgi:hypothetical protein